MKAGQAYVAIFLSLSGCAIVQKVDPITLSGSDQREICLIDNPSVNHDFREAYKTALSNEGLTVRMLPQKSAVSMCELTSTYSANWRWDLALYLTYVNLRVYQNGHLEGEALYDSQSAGLNTNKFINARSKIQELTDQVFSGLVSNKESQQTGH